MPLKSAMGQSCAFIAQHLGLRQRYMFTKNNRLRLRYVASMTAFMAAGVPTAIAFSPLATLPISLEIASTAQAYNFIEPSVLADNEAVSVTGAEIAVPEIASNVPLFDQPAVASDRVVTISQGDALGKVMQDEGVSGDDVHSIISAMDDHFDPRDLRAGQDIHMHFEPANQDGGYQLTDMKIQLNPLKTVVVTRSGEKFESAVEEKEVKTVVQAQKAVIRNSLYASAAKAGIPKTVVSDAIKIYSQNVDFQRDMRAGDALEVMYETKQTNDGYVAGTGNVLYAKLSLGGRDIPLYRYESRDGSVDYYGPDGQSTKKTLMKTPVDGARMSSGFGMRRHPVLGFSKMHKGIDFAAPTGTPIYAAGEGRIVRAGRFGSFGNYVRLKHRSDLETAYAHMSKIAPGIKPGGRVKQGQLIGYVGTTGRSTGPHLHYEVIVNNKHVNPRSVNLPVGQALAGRDLKDFKSFIRQVEDQYASLTGKSVRVAQNQLADEIN